MLTFLTLLPAPTATLSSTQLAAGESCIWATDLQWASRAGGAHLSCSRARVPVNQLGSSFLPPWCHQARQRQSPDQASFLASQGACKGSRGMVSTCTTNPHPCTGHPEGRRQKAGEVPARFKGAQSQPCTVTAREQGALAMPSQHGSAQTTAGIHQKYLPGTGDPTFPLLPSKKFAAHLPQHCKETHPGAPRPTPALQH